MTTLQHHECLLGGETPRTKQRYRKYVHKTRIATSYSEGRAGQDVVTHLRVPLSRHPLAGLWAGSRPRP